MTNVMFACPHTYLKHECSDCMILWWLHSDYVYITVNDTLQLIRTHLQFYTWVSYFGHLRDMDIALYIKLSD